MRHSDAGEGHSNSHSNGHSNSNSSSKIPSSSSSSTPRTRIMEEVLWKDINLPTLNQDSSRPSTPCLSLEPPIPHKSFRGVIMQDFLAGAFKDAAALPPTALSLSSSGDLPPGFVYNGYQGQFAGGGRGCLFSKKVVVDDHSCGGSGGERRYKRMIKNRESAARSRARKQAHANEMELKAARLAAENAELKKQNNKLRLAMAAQVPKRRFLRRTSSGPF